MKLLIVRIEEELEVINHFFPNDYIEEEIPFLFDLKERRATKTIPYYSEEILTVSEFLENFEDEQ